MNTPPSPAPTPRSPTLSLSLSLLPAPPFDRLQGLPPTPTRRRSAHALATPLATPLATSRSQVPGLKKAEIEGKLEEAGIDKVYIFCVNDGAVTSAR